VKHPDRTAERNGAALPPVATPDEGGSILVVDDDAEHRDALADLLRISGFDVCTATDGADALRLVDSMEPALRLILLDVQMPVMDGWELLRQLRVHPRGRHIPVIVTSAADIPRDRLEGVPFFPKPLVVDALLAAVQTHLARRLR
jgi:CheY-like chemotaxis protein